MNAVLSVQGTAVPEETKPSFLSRVLGSVWETANIVL